MPLRALLGLVGVVAHAFNLGIQEELKGFRQSGLSSKNLLKTKEQTKQENHCLKSVSDRGVVQLSGFPWFVRSPGFKPQQSKHKVTCKDVTMNGSSACQLAVTAFHLRG